MAGRMRCAPAEGGGAALEDPGLWKTGHCLRQEPSGCCGAENTVATKGLHTPGRTRLLAQQDGLRHVKGIRETCFPNQMLSETHHWPGGENVNSLKVAGRRGDRRPWAAQAWVVSLLLVAWGGSTPPTAGLGHEPHAQRGIASGHSRRQDRKKQAACGSGRPAVQCKP